MTLVSARASLLPPVDLESPNTPIPVRADDWRLVYDDINRDVILAIPHHGFGWIAYRFAMDRVAALVDQLAGKLGKTGVKAEGSMPEYRASGDSTSQRSRARVHQSEQISSASAEASSKLRASTFPEFQERTASYQGRREGRGGS
jgi:hypothetical protein